MQKNNLNLDENQKLYNVLKEINPSSKKRLSEELFITLRNSILSGELPEGYIFPNEIELCKKLDIGRSTLREAYAPLERLNLICRTKNGTYVNSESEIKNPMNFDLVAKYSHSKDIMEFREIIEVGIAYSAAKNATKDDVKKLESLVKLMKKSFNDPASLTIYDFEFHSELARISGNELFLIALQVVRVSYERFVYNAFKKDLFQQSIEDHLSLIEALRKNDPKMAKTIMRGHLKHIKNVGLLD
ncbi:FadR family transcriptional regulator [Irregularibacter muris]|uniref:FadR family transcriptional regulator n=1 Tax=Irregularibacter muris TaxID=1796619 RepID=A0AAE3HH57_9FIRM|nr:FadR/GntR family transcriptional regulator [Irregularibacter muris]MCR1899364.1 FadR family transcriptional regulator [Irregularibacter muris]